MSKIDELIKEKCPDGVEHKPLWELTTWDKKFNAVDNSKQPKVLKYYYYLANNLKPLVREGGDVKILTTNESDLFTTEDLAKPGTVVEREVVAIPWGGNPVVQYYKGKFVTADNRIAISNDTSILDTKFLYYVLVNKLDEISSFYRGSGIKHPSMAKVLDLSIPVPPLEVQKEIVGMLNSFTELEAELEAELTKRKQQYEHYRDHLLSFENIAGEGGQVEWLTLDDIFDIKNGYTPSKKNPEYWEDGNIPWFRMEDIRQNGRILKDSIQHITSLGVKSSGLFKRNSIMIATTATIGEHALIETDYLSNQQLTNLSIKSDYIEMVLPKYAFYYFFIIDKQCSGVSNFSGGIPIVDQNRFKKLRFPIPPKKIQERIVYVLDNFDAVCNDLKIGLPAEIEARRKQYEYYRDKLLTFPERRDA